MQALIYNGPGKKNLEDRPKPVVQAPTDVVVRITKTTICGTDPHILKVLGHEGVGVIDSGGAGVTTFMPCDRVRGAQGHHRDLRAKATRSTGRTHA
jgi:alcohol dehydrogenase